MDISKPSSLDEYIIFAMERIASLKKDIESTQENIKSWEDYIIFMNALNNRKIL